MRERVMRALSSVQDPELHQDLVTLGMIRDVQASESHVRVEVELTTPACPLKHTIRASVRDAVAAVVPDAEIEVVLSARVRQGTRAAPESAQPLLPHVRNVILVASGKGGVGKSTVAVNLAVALSRLGASVGVMDADIHGPSMPIMLGLGAEPIRPNEDGTFDPIDVHGIKLMSMGFFLPADQAVIWRGPMASKAIVQFARDCRWGALDYLVLDLPPGTGDVQLTTSQKLEVSGAVLVSTPQDVALADVVRGQAMFDKVDVPVIGVVENMSYFLCDECGTRHELFGMGGARAKAEELGLPFLGSLPLVPELRRSGDDGVPLVLADPDAEVSRALVEMARQIAARVSVLAHVRRAALAGEEAH